MTRVIRASMPSRLPSGATTSPPPLAVLPLVVDVTKAPQQGSCPGRRVERERVDPGPGHQRLRLKGPNPIARWSSVTARRKLSAGVVAGSMSRWRRKPSSGASSMPAEEGSTSHRGPRPLVRSQSPDDPMNQSGPRIDVFPYDQLDTLAEQIEASALELGQMPAEVSSPTLCSPGVTRGHTAGRRPPTMTPDRQTRRTEEGRVKPGLNCENRTTPHGHHGPYETWSPLPVKACMVSPKVSESDGCGWMNCATSLGVASQLTAR